MAMKEGAFGHRQKPINSDELEIAIYRALEKQEMIRKLDGMEK
jgi:DNA-binding NtrC family response regulator